MVQVNVFLTLLLTKYGRTSTLQIPLYLDSNAYHSSHIRCVITHLYYLKSTLNYELINHIFVIYLKSVTVLT